MYTHTLHIVVANQYADEVCDKRLIKIDQITYLQ